MTRALPLLLQDVGPWVWGPVGFIVLLVLLFIWSRYQSAKAMAEAKGLMPKPHRPDAGAAPDAETDAAAGSGAPSDGPDAEG